MAYVVQIEFNHIQKEEGKMPRGNKTGPTGDGPMTGRAQGYCTGNNQPGFTDNQGNPGQGFGRGFRMSPRRISVLTFKNLVFRTIFII